MKKAEEKPDKKPKKEESKEQEKESKQSIPTTKKEPEELSNLAKYKKPLPITKEPKQKSASQPATSTAKKSSSTTSSFAKDRKDERIYNIPLRKAFRKSEKRRTNYAIRLIHDFIARHTKNENIKIGKYLNEEIWNKRNPPRRVRVKAIKDGEAVKVELMGHEYIDFKVKPKKERKGVEEKALKEAKTPETPKRKVTPPKEE